MVKHVQKVGGRFYFRRVILDGTRRREVRHRVPDPSSPEFDAVYERLMHEPATIKVIPGSMAELVTKYRRTQEYRKLAPATRKTRNHFLSLIEHRHGDKPYADLTRGTVKQLRDELADKPGLANGFLMVLSVLMNCAVDLELVPANPCRDVKKLPMGEHEPWPATTIQRVMDAADPMLRVAIALHLYTGQRISDVCHMEWSHVDADTIQVMQRKTGKTVWVPMHSTLKAELAKVPRHVRWLIYNQDGKQFKPDRLRGRLAVIWRRLDIPAYRWHGLRKNTVNYLLEAGCSTAEVSGITGQSLQVVEHYAKGRDEKKLARTAMGKWDVPPIKDRLTTTS